MITHFKYSGGTPGADSNTYNAFTTATMPGARALQLADIKRITLAITHSEALTVKAYQSQDRGTNWDQIYDSGSIAAPAATANTVLDFLVEPYQDFKIDIVNGGAAQTTFYVDVSGSDERGPAS